MAELPQVGFPHSAPWIAGLSVVRVLEQFELPLLSELESEDGRCYVEKLCTAASGVQRSILVRSDRRMIARYLAKDATLRILLTEPSDGLAFVVDRAGRKLVATRVAPIASLPESYMPSAEVFHDEDLHPYAETHRQTFLVGSSDWSGRTIADTERRYLSPYAVTYFATSGREMPSQVFHFRYDRGFPVAQYLAETRKVVPKSEMARTVAVGINSPGAIVVEGNTEIILRMMKAISKLNEARQEYETVRSWSRSKPGDYSQVPADGLRDVKRLALKLTVQAQAFFERREMSDKPSEVLVAGKLIAAYYRSLLRLRDESDGSEFLDGRQYRGAGWAPTGDLDD